MSPAPPAIRRSLRTLTLMHGSMTRNTRRFVTLSVCGWVLVSASVVTAQPSDEPELSATDPAQVEADSPAAPDEQPVATREAPAQAPIEAAATPRAPQPDPPAPTAEREEETGRFVFGSYGRISIASDLRGGSGREADLVGGGTRGDRYDLSPYIELQLARHDRILGVRTDVVTTLALSGEPFHLSGELDVDIAIRNAYVQATDVGARGLSIWAGSRMWRGDDIYLLNFWPLDELNTVGGGVGYARDAWRLDLAVGMSRLRGGGYQYQEVAVPSRGFEPTRVVLLDRPRVIGALRGEYVWRPAATGPGLKLVLYGEAHGIASGDRRGADGATVEQLPADDGFVLGAQVSAFLGERDTFANLFVRYGWGLAAYDEIGLPFGLDTFKQASRARELLIALSANGEWGPFMLQAAGFYRYFRDADPNVFDRDDLAEWIVVARPALAIARVFGVAAEASVQGTASSELDTSTGVARAPTLFRLALMPYVSPTGPGSFRRPHLFAVYAITLRSDDARAQYPDEDAFAQRSVEHYLGLGAEWWFDSAYR